MHHNAGGGPSRHVARFVLTPSWEYKADVTNGVEMKQIYLDYNAGTPIAPSVIEAMMPWLADGYGNASSIHWAGAAYGRPALH